MPHYHFADYNDYFEHYFIAENFNCWWSIRYVLTYPRRRIWRCFWADPRVRSLAESFAQTRTLCDRR